MTPVQFNFCKVIVSTSLYCFIERKIFGKMMPRFIMKRKITQETLPCLRDHFSDFRFHFCTIPQRSLDLPLPSLMLPLLLHLLSVVVWTMTFQIVGFDFATEKTAYYKKKDLLNQISTKHETLWQISCITLNQRFLRQVIILINAKDFWGFQNIASPSPNKWYLELLCFAELRLLFASLMLLPLYPEKLVVNLL